MDGQHQARYEQMRFPGGGGGRRSREKMEEDGTESQSGILAVHGTSSLVSFTQFVATSGNTSWWDKRMRDYIES